MVSVSSSICIGIRDYRGRALIKGHSGWQDRVKLYLHRHVGFCFSAPSLVFTLRACSDLISVCSTLSIFCSWSWLKVILYHTDSTMITLTKRALTRNTLSFTPGSNWNSISEETCSNELSGSSQGPGWITTTPNAEITGSFNGEPCVPLPISSYSTYPSR